MGDTFLTRLRADGVARKKRIDKGLRAVEQQLGPAEAVVEGLEQRLQDERALVRRMVSDFAVLELKILEREARIFEEVNIMQADVKSGKVKIDVFHTQTKSQADKHKDIREKSAAELLAITLLIRSNNMTVRGLERDLMKAKINRDYLKSQPRKLEMELLEARIAEIKAIHSDVPDEKPVSSSQLTALEQRINQAESGIFAFTITWMEPMGPTEIRAQRFNPFVPLSMIAEILQLADEMEGSGEETLFSPLTLRPNRQGGDPVWSYNRGKTRAPVSDGGE